MAPRFTWLDDLSSIIQSDREITTIRRVNLFRDENMRAHRTERRSVITDVPSN